jgi:cytochrome bd ubiquinol oxidase subunit II
MSAEQALLWTVGACLVLYCLTAGADFGAGVWDLLASGNRKVAQRAAIEEAIAPIWEVNHIWLIVVVVLLFSGFPHAFATIAVALHVPIALALVGIVLRGAAFVFNAYGLRPTGYRSTWGRTFAWASLITPICLGLPVAGLSSGAIQIEGNRVISSIWTGWATLFGLLLGAFTLSLFALLGACYLARDASRYDAELAEDFRRRALRSEAIAGLLAAAVVVRAQSAAPLFFENLFRSSWSQGVQTLTAGAALTAVICLYRRRYFWAAAAAATQVGLVVVGWGLAMDEHVLLPALPIARAGAVTEVVKPVLWTLAGGTVLLLPALLWLLAVFKAGPARPHASHDADETFH